MANTQSAQNVRRPFRFGFLSSALSRDEWIDKACRVEAAGFSALLVPDHQGTGLAPFSALVAAADATTTLRVGSYVFGNDFRNPVMLAQEAATIDVLSGGRLELGLGTGYGRNDYEQTGIPLESPGVRVNRLEEALHVIKGFFADEPCTYTGRYYKVQELKGSPKSIQRPHPPIMIGGGSRRILSLAAHEADIVSFNIRTTAQGEFDFSSITAEAAAEKVSWVRHAAGEHFDALELSILVPVVAVSEYRRQAAEEILRQYGMPADGAAVDMLLASPSALIGTVDQIIEDLQSRRELYGFTYIVMWDPLEPFIPVVERLVGK